MFAELPSMCIKARLRVKWPYASSHVIVLAYVFRNGCVACFFEPFSVGLAR